MSNIIYNSMDSDCSVFLNLKYVLLAEEKDLLQSDYGMDACELKVSVIKQDAFTYFSITNEIEYSC